MLQWSIYLCDLTEEMLESHRLIVSKEQLYKHFNPAAPRPYMERAAHPHSLFMFQGYTAGEMSCWNVTAACNSPKTADYTTIIGLID